MASSPQPSIIERAPKWADRLATDRSETQPMVEDDGYESNESTSSQDYEQHPRQGHSPSGRKSTQYQSGYDSDLRANYIVRSPVHKQSPKSTQRQSRYDSDLGVEYVTRNPTRKRSSESILSYHPSTHYSQASLAYKSDGRADPDDPLGLQRHRDGRPLNFSNLPYESSYRSRAYHDDDVEDEPERPRSSGRTERHVKRVIRDQGDGFISQLNFGGRKQTSKMLDPYKEHLHRPSSEDQDVRAARESKKYLNGKVRGETDDLHEPRRLRNDKVSRGQELLRTTKPSSRYTGRRDEGAGPCAPNSYSSSYMTRTEYLVHGGDAHDSRSTHRYESSPIGSRRAERTSRSSHHDGTSCDEDANIEYASHHKHDQAHKPPQCHSSRDRKPHNKPIRTFAPDDSSYTSQNATRAPTTQPYHASASQPQLRSSPSSLPPRSSHTRYRSSLKSSPPPFRANATMETKISLPDHYAILNIPSTASATEIARAARKMRIKAHPDRLRKPGMSKSEQDKIDEAAKSVGMAAEVLGDRESRKKYDRDLRRFRVVDR